MRKPGRGVEIGDQHNTGDEDKGDDGKADDEWKWCIA